MMINKISQKSFDYLQEILDVTVDESDYNRWVRNGEIPIESIWDVIKDNPQMAIIDWRSDPDEIIAVMKSCCPGLVLPDGISLDGLKAIIETFNETDINNEILLVGRNWNDSDTVVLLTLSKRQVQMIFSDDELWNVFNSI